MYVRQVCNTEYTAFKIEVDYIMEHLKVFWPIETV